MSIENPSFENPTSQEPSPESKNLDQAISQPLEETVKIDDHDLERIGAEAENESRDITNGIDGVRELGDQAGAEAMIEEISRQARDLIPNATPEVQRRVAEAAVDKLQKEWQAREEEKRQAQEKAAAEADRLIDEINSSDKPIQEILAEYKATAAQADELPASSEQSGEITPETISSEFN